MNLLLFIFLAIAALYMICFVAAMAASLLLIRSKLKEHQERLRFG